MVRVRFLIALLLAGLAFGSAGHAADQLPARHLIQGVPFTGQLRNYCGPASLSSLLAYWKVCLSQEDIGCGASADPDSGTNAGDMLLYCREKGLSAYSFNGTLTDLKRFISKGYPVVTLQDVSQTDSTGHFRVAVGYNDQTGTITFRDSIQAGLVKLAYKAFTDLWKKRGCWAMLVMPPDKDIFAKTLGERNAVTHMDLAQAYLHKGSYGKAETESLKALDIEPTNSYAKGFLAEARKRTAVPRPESTGSQGSSDTPQAPPAVETPTAAPTETPANTESPAASVETPPAPETISAPASVGTSSAPPAPQTPADPAPAVADTPAIPETSE